MKRTPRYLLVLQGCIKLYFERFECLSSLSSPIVKLLENERDLVAHENLILKLLDFVLSP